MKSIGTFCPYLPVDTFYDILHHVNSPQHSRADLLSLMLTCRALHAITLPFLYRNIRSMKRGLAHRCLLTLTKNKVAALSVVDLSISFYLKFDEKDRGNVVPLLPLAAEALLHTYNLKRLVLDCLVYEQEHYELFFQREYSFQLLTLVLTSSPSQDDWNCMIPFLNRQTQLSYLTISSLPPKRLLPYITLPNLRYISLKVIDRPRTQESEDAAAFFAHFTEISAVAIRFFYNPIATLTILRRIMSEMERFDVWPEWMNISSKTLRFLTILVSVKGIRTHLNPALIDSLPKSILLNLTSIFVEYHFGDLHDLVQHLQQLTCRPEMGGIQFYFGRGDVRRALLAKKDRDECEWRVEEVEWSTIPHAHIHAVTQSGTS